MMLPPPSLLYYLITVSYPLIIYPHFPPTAGAPIRLLSE